MTNYALPTHIGIEAIQIRMVDRVRMTESPFSFAQQVVDYGGQRWEADITLPPMDRADAVIWLAWLAKLRGPYHTFTMGDPLAATPQGSAGGTPLVNGGSQTGASLVLDGATTSQTGWLKAGDYIQLGSGADSRMYMVTADADSDGSGNVTLAIWPDIVTAPADNAAVTVSSAVAAWRLSSSVRAWDEFTATTYGLQFSAVSVV